MASLTSGEMGGTGGGSNICDDQRRLSVRQEAQGAGDGGRQEGQVLFGGIRGWIIMLLALGLAYRTASERGRLKARIASAARGVIRSPCMATEFSDRSAHELTDEGYAALDEGRPQDALAIAGELRRRHFSAAFEIEARARWDLGESDAAIAVLEEGVAAAPTAAPLWHWLACYRSDVGRYDAALEAFAREAEFESTLPSANTYNVAVVYERAGRPAEGLDAIARMEAPGKAGPSPEHFHELRARLLFHLDRLDESIIAATAAVDSLEAMPAEEFERLVDNLVLSRAYAVRAIAHARRGDHVAAVEDAEASIAASGGGGETPVWALEALRITHPQRSPRAQRFRLTIEARFREPGELGEGVIVGAEVIADDVDEAAGFVRRFIPGEVLEPLRVEVEAQQPATDDLKGVLWLLGHIFFGSDDSAST